MAAERTRSSDSSADISAGAGQSAQTTRTTPLPQSQQRPTGNTARWLGQPPADSPQAPSVAAESPLPDGRSSLLDGRTEPSGPPSLPPLSLPRATDEASLSLPGATDEPPLSRRSREAKTSAGYYSMRPTKDDAVRIPRAPKVPTLDLEEFGEAPAPRMPKRSSSPALRSGDRSSEVRAKEPPGGEPRDTIRTPPPVFSRSSSPPARRPASSHPPTVVRSPASSRPSTPPPPMQEARSLTPLPEEKTGDRRSRSPSVAPPRVYFAPHVRAQANRWAETGALSLPGCASPRHARALQRALLLALLHEPGWFGIPMGLRQRAGWLFCAGWESGAGAAHPFREVDDLAMVLGLEVNQENRRTLSTAIATCMPDDYSSRPPPSSQRGK